MSLISRAVLAALIAIGGSCASASHRASTTSAAASSSTTSTTAAAAKPDVRHVFEIVLENEEETSSFPGTGTELDQLAKAGVFLPDFYATGHESLDNYLAMVSGQAQFSSTSQDCPLYKNASGSIDARGFYLPMTPQDTGCVYPSDVRTLPDQLTAVGLTWHGYMQDMGNTTTRETSPCGQPASAGVAVDPSTGGPDDTQLATASDQYAARHNPFVYFHSLIDTPSGASQSPCAANVTPLTQLTTDLTSNHVATWNFITPNLCNDGHDSPCKGPGAEGANPGAGGLTSANAFLAQLVPQIQKSKAYRQGGLIVITFDEGTSNKACCGESAYSTGGGQIGAVLLGKDLHPHTSTCAYNHCSLLRTWENLFDLSVARTKMFGSDRFGHLAHAGDPKLVPLTRELTARRDPCRAS